MEISQLKYFLAAAETEHITRAAEHLHLAQPALTKSIRALEEEMGVKLFGHRGRNVFLTEYGIYLKERLSRLLPELEGLAGEVSAMRERVENTVTINVLAASNFFTELIIEFKKRNPHAIIRLIQNEEDSRCDIVVTTAERGAKTAGDFTSVTKAEEGIFIAVPRSSRFNKMSSVQLKDLQTEGFISLAGSRHFRAVCDRLCAKAGFRPRTVFESDSPVAVRNLIEAGAGIGFWPEYSWGQMPVGNVALIPLEEECKREIIMGFNGAGANAMAEGFYRFAEGRLKGSAHKKK